MIRGHADAERAAQDRRKHRAAAPEGVAGHERRLMHTEEAMEALSPFRLAPYFRTRPWGFQDLRPWFDYRTDGEPIGEVWLTGEMCAAETGPLQGRSLADVTRKHRAALLGS